MLFRYRKIWLACFILTSGKVSRNQVINKVIWLHLVIGVRLAAMGVLAIKEAIHYP